VHASDRACGSADLFRCVDCRLCWYWLRDGFNCASSL